MVVTRGGAGFTRSRRLHKLQHAGLKALAAHLLSNISSKADSESTPQWQSCPARSSNSQQQSGPTCSTILPYLQQGHPTKAKHAAPATGALPVSPLDAFVHVLAVAPPEAGATPEGAAPAPNTAPPTIVVAPAHDLDINGFLPAGGGSRSISGCLTIHALTCCCRASEGGPGGDSCMHPSLAQWHTGPEPQVQIDTDLHQATLGWACGLLQRPAVQRNGVAA